MRYISNSIIINSFMFYSIFMLIFKKIFKMLTKLIKNITGVGTTKMVLIVRTDLKMSPGKIASQSAHAAITLYDSATKSNEQSAVLKHWLRWGQPKVVLKISENCENRMKEMFAIAKNNGLNACLIRDAGKTQIQSGSLTVLGIGPNLVEDIDKITSSLKLL